MRRVRLGRSEGGRWGTGVEGLLRQSHCNCWSEGETCCKDSVKIMTRGKEEYIPRAGSGRISGATS